MQKKFCARTKQALLLFDDRQTFCFKPLEFFSFGKKLRKNHWKFRAHGVGKITFKKLDTWLGNVNNHVIL